MSNTATNNKLGRSDLKRIYRQVSKKVKNFVVFHWIRQLYALFYRLVRVAEKPSSLSIHIITQPTVETEGCKGLTVISANLWHDWPKHRRSLERLEAFSKLVEEHNADVLLLQEVARTTKFWTDDWLSNRLGMTSLYSRANGHLQGIGFEEGLGIFSAHPMTPPVLHQLSPQSSRFVHRMALGTQVKSPCGDFLAFSVHLGLNRKQNTRQANQLYSWVQKISDRLPAVVGGDFNAGEFSRSIKSLKENWIDTFRHLNPFADGTTHEIHWPWGKPLKRSRLDYIFLKAEQPQWQLLEAHHLQTPGEKHSDHRAVLLRLAPAYAAV